MYTELERQVKAYMLDLQASAMYGCASIVKEAFQQMVQDRHKIAKLEARVKELEKEADVLKTAILTHHENRFFMGYDRINNEILYSTILPGFSANGTTLRDPPYPVLKEVK